MKTHILKLLQLKQLYKRVSCGEQYTNTFHHPSQPQAALENNLESIIKNCSLCNRIKHCKEPSFGILNPQSQLCFITEIPLVDEKGVFIQNKSALMIQNIIHNVFRLQMGHISLLSLVKCDAHNPYLDKSNILSCMGFCLTQLQKITPKVCILLGNQVAEHILGQRLEHSRILWHNNKKFLITHPLNELVRNPSLKKEAHNDFLIAKGQL